MYQYLSQDMNEDNQYILGTEQAELHRLGIQHQVWASEAQEGWRLANFSSGQTLLDLGSGPGFATKELAYITGNLGKVIAVDRSSHFINFVQKEAVLHGLNIETICSDFNDMNLEPNSLDGMYCRWAMAWVSNPKEILKKVYDALKPGGKMVIHEYFDWSTHQTQPKMNGLAKGIAACLKSFEDQEGDIDVGRQIPQILSDFGMRIKTRPMIKMATPSLLTWQWPKSFYEVYFPKLAKMGYLKNKDVSHALADMEVLEQNINSHLFCPTLIEVVAEKM